MSQADILLNSLGEEQTTTRIAGTNSTEEHIVVGEDRFITVPESLKRIAVQFDHNVETVTFDCIRYWDGIDLSKMSIFIVYLRPDGQHGKFLATDITVDKSDSNIIHFNWTISRNVTEVNGKVTFIVCAKQLDSDGNEEYHWNSEANSDMTVSQGMECDNESSDEYPADVIMQLLDRMDALEQLYEDSMYEPISISSFYGSPSTVEYGSTGQSVTFRWTTNKVPKTVTIKYGSTTKTVTCTSTSGSYTVTGLSITSSNSFTLTVTGEKSGETASKTTYVSYGYNVYYGAAAYIDTVDSNFVKTNLSKSLRTSKMSSINANATNNAYVYYCQPVAFGECSFYDETNFEVAMENIGTIDVPTTSGASTSYYVYRSQYANWGSITITIK